MLWLKFNYLLIMTREEAIKCASKDYVNYLLDKQEYHNEDYTEDDIRQAFEKGAMFADKNPDLASLWHDASEEPKCKELLIIYCEDIGGLPINALIYHGSVDYPWKELVKTYNIIYWAYAKDILPKGGKQ